MIQSNKRLAGIWVDHANAWVVRYDKGHETIEKILSHVESRVRETGGSGQSRVPHHKIEGRRHEQSHRFYDEIISKIGDVDELLLMGPSSAKQELKKYIAKNKSLARRLRDLLPADHMTDRQIAARVREYFHLGNDLNELHDLEASA